MSPASAAATATLALLVLAAAEVASAVTFAVPSQALTGGLRYAPLDPAPVGISYVRVDISFGRRGSRTMMGIVVVAAD